MTQIPRRNAGECRPSCKYEPPMAISMNCEDFDFVPSQSISNIDVAQYCMTRMGSFSLEGPHSAADSVRIPRDLGQKLISMVYDDFNTFSSLICLNVDVVQHCMTRNGLVLLGNRIWSTIRFVYSRSQAHGRYLWFIAIM